MPQRPKFNLTSESLIPMLDTMGVLETLGEEPTTKTAILGAYFDEDPEFSGLYVLPSKGEIKFFEIALSDIESVGLSEDIAFDADGTSYVVRNLQGSDGEWLSAIKTELPVEVLYKIVISSSNDTIGELVGVELTEELPSFESLYIYYDETLNSVVSLVYLSGYGTYARLDASWTNGDISSPLYQSLETIEIDPGRADEFINNFDDAFGLLSVEEAMKYENKGLEEGESVE